MAASYVREKCKEQMIRRIRQQVKIISKQSKVESIVKLNSMILGMQQYYKCATNVSVDFSEIAFRVREVMRRKLVRIAQYRVPTKKPYVYEKFYGKSNSRTWIIGKMPINPIHCIKHQSSMNFTQETCDYTAEGRRISSKVLNSTTDAKVIILAKQYIPNRSIQYNDNRISRASMCRMKCEVTGIELDINTLHCHHVISYFVSKNDEYDNLRIVHKDIHVLIHAVEEKVIHKYITLIENKENLKRLNALRAKCGLEEISLTA